MNILICMLQNNMHTIIQNYEFIFPMLIFINLNKSKGI